MTNSPARVVQKLTERKGELTDMRPSGVGRTRHSAAGFRPAR